jgi:hypothetical protein
MVAGSTLTTSALAGGAFLDVRFPMMPVCCGGHPFSWYFWSVLPRQRVRFLYTSPSDNDGRRCSSAGKPHPQPEAQHHAVATEATDNQRRPKTDSFPAGTPRNPQRNTLQSPEKEGSGNSPNSVEIRNMVSFQIVPLALKRYS